jgi:hypothetical protein
MTPPSRLNARLDPEMARKVAYLRERTGLKTSEVVRTSIEHYYRAVRSGGAKAREVLESTGFIASGSGSPKFSEDYKKELTALLEQKHR